MLQMIISGGQTGADRIGLEEALKVGLPTSGMAPKGYYTENGPDLTLKDFGLIESPVMGYTHRTKYNAAHSDGTVLFGDMSSLGSFATIQYCIKIGKPYITNPQFWELAEWITKHNIQILNIAGNRGSKLDTLKQLAIRNCLHEAFKKLGLV